jgi:hypothetical protein
VEIMAETATSTPTKNAADDLVSAPPSDDSLARMEAEDGPAARRSAPHIVLRLLLGFAGLTLLVGFFLPWLRLTAEGPMANGLELMTSDGAGTAGTPSMLLILIPALGAALSATAFMGFKWSGQVAVGVATVLIGYALYVLLQMFVQHTGLGLWVVSGGTFVILLLGVITWMTGRDRKDDAADEAAAKKKI